MNSEAPDAPGYGQADEGRKAGPSVLGDPGSGCFGLGGLVSESMDLLLYLGRQVPVSTMSAALPHGSSKGPVQPVGASHSSVPGWPEDVSAHMGLQHRALSCGGLTWLSRGTIDARNWPEMKQHRV